MRVWFDCTPPIETSVSALLARASGHDVFELAELVAPKAKPELQYSLLAKISTLPPTCAVSRDSFSIGLDRRSTSNFDSMAETHAGWRRATPGRARGLKTGSNVAVGGTANLQPKTVFASPSGRGRDAHYSAPPALNRTCGFPARQSFRFRGSIRDGLSEGSDGQLYGGAAAAGRVRRARRGCCREPAHRCQTRAVIGGSRAGALALANDATIKRYPLDHCSGGNRLTVIPGRALARARNFTIPGSMLSHRPGMINRRLPRRRRCSQ